MTATMVEELTAAPICCQRCGEFANTSVVGKARNLGWRIFEGKSLTGRDLSHRFCPACSGVTPVGEDGKPAAWDAICNTCGLSMSEDWQDDEPDDDEGWTKKHAEDWRSDHECEPDVELIAPKNAADGHDGGAA